MNKSDKTPDVFIYCVHHEHGVGKQIVAYLKNHGIIPFLYLDTEPFESVQTVLKGTKVCVLISRERSDINLKQTVTFEDIITTTCIGTDKPLIRINSNKDLVLEHLLEEVWTHMSLTRYDVFISAKSEDYNLAEEVYDFLTGTGLSVFLASKELKRIGKSGYGRVIDEAIERSNHMVVVASSVINISSSYVESEWRSFWEEVRSGNKKGNLLTIVSDSVDKRSLPLTLRQNEAWHWREYRVAILQYLKVEHDIKNPKIEHPLNRRRKRGVQYGIVTCVLLLVMFHRFMSIHNAEITDLDSSINWPIRFDQCDPRLIACANAQLNKLAILEQHNNHQILINQETNSVIGYLQATEKISFQKISKIMKELKIGEIPQDLLNECKRRSFLSQGILGIMQIMEALNLPKDWRDEWLLRRAERADRHGHDWAAFIYRDSIKWSIQERLLPDAK